MYQLGTRPDGEAFIYRPMDDIYIPVDPLNKDYQQYQIWLAAGNTPGVYPANG